MGCSLPGRPDGRHPALITWGVGDVPCLRMRPVSCGGGHVGAWGGGQPAYLNPCLRLV